MIIIGKPINGISINGLEWLLDKNNQEMKFEAVEKAKEFLRTHGYEDLSDDDMEDSFIFEEIE